MPQHLNQHGAKVILPLVFKAGGNTKTIAIHLREVHYRMVIVWSTCWSFTSMNAQSMLDHCSGCKAKHNEECVEQEGEEMAKKLHKQKSNPNGEWRHANYPAQRSPRSHKEWTAAQHLLSSPARECKLAQFLTLSRSSQLHFLGEALLSQMNCHLFLQLQCVM